ncbi:White hypersensitive protein [Panaeolus cyanescens]|uniref:White hypersensitive protein n=1 Tax=Panaeolus cyanescens TaxID=181874 RepID=A0A409Y6X6_9AGAR|nr:White hypersensitive protein [Panaeolus cyanescens]
MAASISAAAIARAHTIFSSLAFLSALLLGLSLHYKKIVKNDVAGYPQEWFPSVSATIGDWFPERNIFQILIALTAGPRFALVFLQYYIHHNYAPNASTWVFLSGLVRTLSCGGWVFITSSDHHDVHDFMMILYMVCNIPWMLLGIVATPSDSTNVRSKRKFIATLFFGTIGPLVYFFIRHKVHRIPGAYTRYAFFEWGLIFFDVAYDYIAQQEFQESGLEIAFVLPTSSGAKQAETDNTRPSETTLADSPLDAKAIISADPSLNNTEKDTPETIANETTAKYAKAVQPTTSRYVISFFSDVYLAYVFWSIFTSLIPTLFYFSVWELGIAGNELALLSVLSPVLLNLSSPYYSIFEDKKEVNPPTVFDFVKTRRGQAILHLASLIGLVAYLGPSPGIRLALVFVASIIVVLQRVVSWAGLVAGEGDPAYQGIVIGLGIMVSDVLRQANRGNNPIWPFINHKANGWNNTGIVLTLLAVFEYSSRPTNLAPISKETPLVRKQSPSIVLNALPLGSLLFCLHNFLSEPSTLIAWSWTGYTNGSPNGPVPHIHGFFTVGAMTLGLLYGLLNTIKPAVGQKSNILPPLLWFHFGAASCYVMYTYRNWLGYIGGLGVAMFLMSIIPLVFQTAANAAVYTDATSGRTVYAVRGVYTTAFVVYCLLNLASIFTVAYAFVPGGVYFRERTDLVTIIQTACLLPAFLNLDATPPRSARSSSFFTGKFMIMTSTLVSVLTLLSIATTYYRMPTTLPQPFKPGTRIINTGIWTVHFGIDNEGHDSQKGMMNVIKDMELDIIGLLETDLHRTSFGHRDLTRLIVEEMNYNVDIGPGPNSHTWGAVLLSKFPIISTKHHLLPSPHGELAPAIEAVLDVYGTEILVIVSHNGQEEDPLDRELQSTELAKIMAASTRPVIFLGYLVTKPHAKRPNPYAIISEEGRVHDIDEDDMSRWVSQGIITDTEVQIGQFVLPRHGHNVTDDSKEARYRRSRKEELGVDHWFPMAYYGNKQQGGVNGHYYDVFGTVSCFLDFFDCLLMCMIY